MIRFACIGTSWITEKFIEAALATGKYQFVAVYSRSEEKAKAFLGARENVKIFTDLQAMAEDEMVDAVYIASPNSHHFAHSKLMLTHHKDVICEKPLCSNEDEVRELIAVAKEHKQVLFEAMKIPYLPNYQWIKENLFRLGTIRKVVINYCQYSSRYPKYLAGENPNTFNPEFSNGSIMDIGVYPLNFVIGLFGAPQSIQATASLLASGVDGTGSVILNYGDFDAVILHSKVSDSFIPSEIQGEAGALIIEHPSIVASVSYQSKTVERRQEGVEHVDNDMQYEADAFAQCVMERRIDHLGLQQSLLASQLLTEIRRQTGVVFPADSVKRLEA